MKLKKAAIVSIPAILIVVLVTSPWPILEKEAAQKTSARTVISQLELACDDYFEEYQQFPLGNDTNTDQVQLSNGEESNTLMTALCSLASAEDESYKTKNFFTFKKPTIDGKNGLIRNEDGSYAELFDPWGNPYHVLLDYDYNRQLKDPFTGEIIADVKSLIWSPGPDKKSGTDDDIRSWE